MSFHEKSAWVMLIALLILAGFCSLIAFDLTKLAPITLQTDQSSLLHADVIAFTPFFIAAVIALVVVAVLGHSIIAIMSPKEANAATDERERHIMTQASHYASYVLSFGVVLGLLQFLFNHSGSQFFFIVLASLTLSQLIEYLMQIVMFRRA